MTRTIEETEAAVLSGMRGEVAFDDALAAVVAYQLEHNEPLRRWWNRRGFDGSSLDWTLIPAVPTDAFRTVALRSSERAPVQIFRTSGTTSGARGEHAMVSTRAYEWGAALQWRRWVQPEGERLRWVSLAFSPREVPDSSLGFMLGALAGEFASDVSWHAHPDHIDAAGAAAALRASGSPVMLVGTAFALVELLDRLAVEGALQLPEGSRVVETGGFKGRTRELERGAFYAELSSRLGVPAHAIVSEYSMTELSSQLYTDALVRGSADGALLQPPPWCRVNVVDPQTLQSAPDGTVGLLRFVDLANVSSVVAVQTADIGVVTSAGVALRGRAVGAVARGCSLAVEEIVALRDGAEGA